MKGKNRIILATWERNGYPFHVSESMNSRTKDPRSTKGRASLDRTALLAAALSDPIRLRLLSLILHNPDICVCDLEAVTMLPQTKISKHLAVLRKAGLVAPRRQGTWMHYSIAKPNGAVQYGLLDVVRKAHTTVPELQRDLTRLNSTVSCSPERAMGKLIQEKPQGIRS